ncbi:hypothetical protein IRP63_05280 [Clostridium botulinum]|uniref:Uncharacterized protein n=1 Tax=Clostridium botulinum C/D str. DC5 TaxID=1443128 RepID=A0A0A0IJA4_CLOBO|nr:hypothetical protein [Clostridium botulinum]KGN00332.1 hypothetical protein Z955_03900 [Clostridium botulinum C/D str. DC5]KOC51338.1 hypothetical protein ADU89_13825 [Clostridium botulinum]KOC53702.1 hypothetical protein ADU90_13205 [Clostridium botulinum]MCD3234589.1 hypothetical protein [Clostridium botulinum D/C]MCD3239732.1 hypothetical protein [Clostridium botulinum D/C]
MKNEQLSLFKLPQVGEKIEYISCGKKYKGIVKCYSHEGKYIDCTTNQKGFSGVSLHVENKGKDWFLK